MSAALRNCPGVKLVIEFMIPEKVEKSAHKSIGISSQGAQRIKSSHTLIHLMQAEIKPATKRGLCWKRCPRAFNIAWILCCLVNMKMVETAGDLVEATSSARSNFRMSGLVYPKRANRTGHFRASFFFDPCDALAPGGLAFAALLFLG